MVTCNHLLEPYLAKLEGVSLTLGHELSRQKDEDTASRGRLSIRVLDNVLALLERERLKFLEDLVTSVEFLSLERQQ